MAYYPVFLDLERRPCVVVGGGELLLERKVEALVRAGASVTVVTAEPGSRIEAMARSGRIVLRRRPYADGDLAGADLAIAWSEDPDERQRLAAEARRERCLLNVVDVPELCRFIAPAVLDRGDLQVAVSSSASAPALASAVRDRIGERIGPEYEIVARVLRLVREELRRAEPSAAERARILRALAGSPLAERIRERDRAGLERLLAEVGGAAAARVAHRADLGVGGS